MKIKEKFTYNDMKELIASLGVRYTMLTFRFCAENDVKLDKLAEYTPVNLRTLVQVGTKGQTKDEAYAVIEKWMEEGYTCPALHVVAYSEARDSGFFIAEQEIKAIGELGTSQDAIKAYLPVLSQEVRALSEYASSLTAVL